MITGSCLGFRLLFWVLCGEQTMLSKVLTYPTQLLGRDKASRGLDNGGTCL